MLKTTEYIKKKKDFFLINFCIILQIEFEKDKEMSMEEMEKGRREREGLYCKIIIIIFFNVKKIF